MGSRDLALTVCLDGHFSRITAESSRLTKLSLVSNCSEIK